ncbi:MAG: hypothetical protein U9M92_02865 [Patescibacteria group bacterium]|nr:hypothetical protein [Patescibacteria group bacterium]
MATLKGLCMRCRDSKNKPTMQEMTGVKVSEKNNRFSAKGTCGKCSGNMFKFLSKDDAKKFK